MMKDDDDGEPQDFFPEPVQQSFGTKLEEDLGYEIDDPNYRNQLEEEIYNRPPSPQFGFDPEVAARAAAIAAEVAEKEGKPPPPAIAVDAYVAGGKKKIIRALEKPPPPPIEEEDELPKGMSMGGRQYVMPKSSAAPGGNEYSAIPVVAGIDGKNLFVPTKGNDMPLPDTDFGSRAPPKKATEVSFDASVDTSPGDHYVGSVASSVAETDYETDDGGGGAGVSTQHVRVAIRIRPMQPYELVSKKKKKYENTDNFKSWSVLRDGNKDVLVQRGVARKLKGKTTFPFDAVFEAEETTETVYDDFARPILESVLSGRNGTLFSYGQTGSGKTYTVQGGSGQKGLIHWAAADLFKLIKQDDEREYSVFISYFEIYNEQARDLLESEAEEENQKSRRATAIVSTVQNVDVDLRVLQVREKDGEVFVDATKKEVANVHNITRLLHKGNRNRASAKTDLNEMSSRSHAIFRIAIESHTPRTLDDDDLTDEGENIKRSSVLNFVDLAGSENSQRAATSGSRKREGGKINQSLLSLSQVIQALSLPVKKRPKFINYRNSKLTRILQPHLSGNAVMGILCCVTVSKKHLEETRMTLKFAYSAKKITVTPTVNEVSDDKSVILNLKKELHDARIALKDLKETQAQIIIQAPPEIRTLADFTSTMDEFPFLDKMLSTMDIDGEDIFFQAEQAPDEKEQLDPPEGEADGEANDEPEGEEESPEDVERFRQEILAKFMALMEDGGSANSGDGDQEGEEIVSVEDNGDREVVGLDTEAMEEDNIVAESDGEQEEENKSIQNGQEDHDNPAVRSSDEIEENSWKHDDDEESTDLDLFHDPDPDVDVVDTKILAIYDRITSIHERPKTEDELINSFRHELFFKMQEIMEVARSETGGAESADGLSRTELIALADELVDRMKVEIDEKLRGVGEHYLGAPEQNDHRIPNTLANMDAQLPSDDDSSLSSSPGVEVEKFENEMEEKVLDGATYETFESEASPRKRQPRNMSMVPVVDGRGIHQPSNEIPVLSNPVRSKTRLLSMIPAVDGKVFGSGGIERGSGVREGSPINAISSVGGANADEEIQSDISSEQSKENDPAIINWKNSVVPNNEGVSKKEIDPAEVVVTKDNNKNAVKIINKDLDQVEQRAKALSERIDTTDRLVEALFVELENARSFVREIVFEGTDAENRTKQPSSSYLGGSGVVVVDEFLMRQCGVLKFSIYLSLAFYVFGQHELFLASVFFIWLSLEVVTKI